MDDPYVYISGALTVMDEALRRRLRERYEAIGVMVAKKGFGYYCPHEHSDPTMAAELTPQDVDEIDRMAVTRSALVIAEVSLPSHGPGIEIEMANKSSRPVMLLVEKGKRVSRLVLGNPAVIATIQYTTTEDLEFKLGVELVALRERVHKSPIPNVLKARLHPAFKP